MTIPVVSAPCSSGIRRSSPSDLSRRDSYRPTSGRPLPTPWAHRAVASVRVSTRPNTGPGAVGLGHTCNSACRRRAAVPGGCPRTKPCWVMSWASFDRHRRSWAGMAARWNRAFLSDILIIYQIRASSQARNECGFAHGVRSRRMWRSFQELTAARRGVLRNRWKGPVGARFSRSWSLTPRTPKRSLSGAKG